MALACSVSAQKHVVRMRIQHNNRAALGEQFVSKYARKIRLARTSLSNKSKMPSKTFNRQENRNLASRNQAPHLDRFLFRVRIQLLKQLSRRNVHGLTRSDRPLGQLQLTSRSQITQNLGLTPNLTVSKT